MPLNPFAREYVPGAGKQKSLLNVTSTALASDTAQLPASTTPAQAGLSTQRVGSARCPTPAAEKLEEPELQFEDVFEAEIGPPSPRSHLSPASPGGLSPVRKSCKSLQWKAMHSLALALTMPMSNNFLLLFGT